MRFCRSLHFVEYALRYAVTGNEADAQQAIELLRAFARVMGDWPVLGGQRGSTNREWISQDNTRVYRNWGAGGAFGS